MIKRFSYSRYRFLAFALMVCLCEGCLPTRDGLSGVTGGGGGNNANSAENLGPSDFEATPNSTTQIDLTWTDKSDGQESFALSRSTDGVHFTSVATLSGGVTSYSDVGLSSGVTYSYQLTGILSSSSSLVRAASSQVAAASTWTQLAHSPAGGVVGTLLLLPNGDVMAQGFNCSKSWYLLTPDSTGSYVNGTWSTLASMSLERLYFGSNILPNGKVFVIGGEYSGSSCAENDVNSGEIYDPVANSWASISTIPTSLFGDDPTQVLSDGTILCGGIVSDNTYDYDYSKDSWTLGPTKLYGDRSDEETWVKLADGSFLSYDIFGDAQEGQRYVPALNAWYDAGKSPVTLQNGISELGPALLLPSGRVFFEGASGHTALYTGPTDSTGTGSWVAGPDIPNSLGANDAPAAELPSGHVLLAASNASSFQSPTEIFDYDPTANSMAQVTTPAGMGLSSTVAYTTRMLVLPTGQILFNTGSSLWIYTSSGEADPPWKPTITSISPDGDGVYTLTGTQLTGMSEGSTYGDDAENSTNFPIVEIVDSSGTVRYGRTHDWSSVGVQTSSASVTTQFTLPSGISSGSGSYTLYVIASGISSKAFTFTP